jgi:nitrogen PTS system EIIA component
MEDLGLVEQTKKLQNTVSASALLKEKKGWFAKNQMVKISDYLDLSLVFFLNSTSNREAIEQMIEGLKGFELVPDKNIFKKAVIDRERIVSTGIGMGVAVPHAKLASVKKFFIAIGIQKGKGIEWNAIDRSPVRLIFMIGGPDNRQNEYLQILSRLTRIIKDEELRKKIISSKKSEEVIKLLAPF